MSTNTREPLRIVAPFFAHTGYSKMARAVLRAALLAGYEVQAVESDGRMLMSGKTDGRITSTPLLPEPTVDLPEYQDAELKVALDTEVPPGSPTLLIQLPHNLANWSKYADGPMIGWTMGESDGMIEMWRHGARNVDLLLAPSMFVLDNFRRNMPEVPSDMLPLPVDERLWEAEEFKAEIPKRPPFLFLSVFKPSERKNWRVLLQAFAEEFANESDDVGLLLKTAGHGDVMGLASCCRDMGAWVQVDTEVSTDYMLAALYRACDVYVQPSCEGFGLPYVEAALIGKPSVSLNLGGGVDVVTPTTGYLVPSRMEPIIGLNPFVYPRTHKFAMCSVDDLRATLRRAYEDETKGAGRGNAAKRRAETRFTCSAVANRLKQCIEAAKYVRRQSVEASAAPGSPEWVTVAGNWGDVICSIGNARAVMERTGVKSVGVLFYGSDPRVAEWLEAQPWVREVVAIIERDKKVMTPTFMRMCAARRIHAAGVWAELLEGIGRADIGSRPVAFTHLDLASPPRPQYWEDPVLSVESRAWADVQAKMVGEPFILLQPISLASNPMRNHWRFWSDAIEWVLEHSRVKVVLVGEKVWDEPWPANPKLIDICGQTPSMQHVLALAERSSGCITTANNLPIYNVIAGIPSVVCITSTCGPETFYHKWMEREPLTLVENGDAMEQFKEAVTGRFRRMFDLNWQERVHSEIREVVGV